jgi:hypothetical protein
MSALIDRADWNSLIAIRPLIHPTSKDQGAC